MKYITLLCDGMADRPVPGKYDLTPMQAAHKPNMDALAADALVGMAKTVPDSLSPGSDVANLAVLGYDPEKYYTGRSPLEAESIGVPMTDRDVALRCNLVTLSDEEKYGDKRMVDYCAGDIHTEEADELIKFLEKELGNEAFTFFTGTAYRHCLRWKDGNPGIGRFTPPHDISGRVVGEYLNSDPAAEPFIALMKKSYELLKNHPVNLRRTAEGKNPANSIWLWGQGRKTTLPLFTDKTGLRGGMISAVDLLKGIAVAADMKVCEVKGATGYIDTDFEGKADAAISALSNGCDFVYVHVEAPDECGHRGEADNKRLSIELIDQKILGRMLPALRKMGDFRILICPDHPTPLDVMTHTRDAVPFMIYDSRRHGDGVGSFTEETAASTGVFIEKGYTLSEILIEKQD